MNIGFYRTQRSLLRHQTGRLLHWGTINITIGSYRYKQSARLCGNKMPTRCNRGFYCRSYCLLNMFRASLCPSSGAQEYYTVVAACGIWCCGFQVVGLVWSWGLCVRTRKPQLWFSSCWSGVELRVMCPDTQPSAPHQTSNLKTTARNTTGSNHCPILLSSWCWA